MHPILMTIGSFPVHIYNIMQSIGALTGATVIQRHAVRSKLDSDKTLVITASAIFIAMLGARLFYVLQFFSYFMDNPLEILNFRKPGSVFYGGPLAGVPFLIWSIKKYKLPVWKTMDIFPAGLALAQSFGRLGCLAAGCCYGKPTESTWYGVKLYSDVVEKSHQGILLHPAQLYEAVAQFCLFLGLLAVFKYKKFDGQVAISYFLAYPIIRSVIEIYRGDLIRGFVIDGLLSTSQFVSMLIFITAFATLIFRLNQVKKYPELALK